MARSKRTADLFDRDSREAITTVYEVTRARKQDFDRVYPVLEAFQNTRLTREDWQSIFENHWDSDEDYFGHILCDGGQVVGFAGIIFARRTIEGRTERFGNISNWILKDEYRGKGLIKPLIKEQLQLSEHTLTVFTPAEATQAVLAKKGFRTLDDEMRIVLGVPSLALSRQATLDFNVARIQGKLGTGERKIVEDHLGLRCRFLLIESPDGPCLVVFNRIRRDHLPFARVLYVGDRNVLTKYLRSIVFRFCLRARVVGIVLMQRLVRSGLMPYSITRRKVEIYRSDRVSKSKVDLLYSEMPILGH